jgi:hypothetical protein
MRCSALALVLAFGLGAGCLGQGLDTGLDDGNGGEALLDPRSIQGLQVWLKASHYSYLTDGATVSANWLSEGDLAIGLVPIGGQEPIYDTTAGLGGEASTLLFSGAQQIHLSSANFAAAADGVTIIVLARTNNGDPGGILGITQGSDFMQFPAGTSDWLRIYCPSNACRIEVHEGATGSTQTPGIAIDNGYHVHTGVWDRFASPSTDRLRYEVSGYGSQNVSATPSVLDLSGYLFVGQAAVSFTGNVAEILIWNRALTADERQRVQEYLHRKYALP